MKFRIEIDAIIEADDIEHAYKFWEDHFRALSIKREPKPFMGKAEIREMADDEPTGLLKSNVRYYPRETTEQKKD
ncbi:MAG: hypothetical protein V3W20_11430 [Candidatus Neomarinimicrobiota bacterium]